MNTTTSVDVEFLSKIPLFSKLQQKDLEHLAVLWNPVSKQEGLIIFKKGEPSDAMYVVRGGKIGITVWTQDNQELTLTNLHEGDFFGELGLFDGSPRTANAKVIEKTDLLEMKRDDFLSFLRSNPDVAISLAGVIAQRLRSTNSLLEQRTSRNVNEEIEEHETFGHRIADKVAELGGSWPFVLSFTSLIALWMFINGYLVLIKNFDPFPFAFLNLFLSCVAAVQAPLIMMSQNRQSEKDRLRSELDYQVNLKSELQIQSMHVKLDEMRAYEITQMREVQSELIELLRKQEEIVNKILADKK